MCTDGWMSICTDITTHLVGPFTWLVAKMCEEWKLSLSLFITNAVCCCFLPFFFLEMSSKQYKMTRGKIKASLFHSWVTVTDGHVHSAKTNSSSDKHNRVRGAGERICQDPHSQLAVEREQPAFAGVRRGLLIPALEGMGTQSRAEEPAKYGLPHLGGLALQLLHPISHQVLLSLFLQFLPVSLLFCQFVQAFVIPCLCYFFFS